MSDLEQFIRDYNADPDNIISAKRLITALLRERTGKPQESKKAIAFFISCQTGCTCCNNENHLTGPYRSLCFAREVVDGYKQSKRLASQYSKNGIYEIGWSEVEILPDGRIVADDHIFGGFDDDPNFDGYNEDLHDNEFSPDSYNIDGTKKYGKKLPDWYVDPFPIQKVEVKESQ